MRIGQAAINNRWRVSLVEIYSQGVVHTKRDLLKIIYIIVIYLYYTVTEVEKGKLFASKINCKIMILILY